MPAMPRRRSRYVLVVAVVVVFVLYRAFSSSDWDAASSLGSKFHVPSHGFPFSQYAYGEDEDEQNPGPPGEGGGDLPGNPGRPEDRQYVDLQADREIRQEDLLVVVNTMPESERPTPDSDPVPSDGPVAANHNADDAAAKKQTKNGQAQGHRPTTQPSADNEIHAKNPPGRLPDDKATAPSALPSQIHWKKQHEHYPVPAESLIPLPTGTPKKFPKIQADIKPEGPAEKEKREKRLAVVKAEAERSWAGYRKYAWLHDELAPVSLQFRDPFCGWSATLVDALDTLWIMGLRDEFDEAARAVETIDFTFSSKRRDIPVFETIIRYLGGLLSAYDVSGGRDGQYPVLLDKAVELAEILMGVFDTPNRMPVLYYNWMPEYASQPRRATMGSVAELASMSMEFTRLAQLTGKDKYYDAIARITNELKGLQERGTFVDGLFPELLELSGCNKTATRELRASQEAERQKLEHAQAQAQAQAEEPQGYKPGDAPPGSSEDDEPLPRGDAFEPAKPDSPLGKRAVRSTTGGSVQAELTTPNEGQPPFHADGQSALYDCVPQGVEPAGFGYQQYSMGGSQDSAYEYFPKEDLVLGGLVPEYKELHINTVEAMKKWLLYRPMIADEGRELLFSAFLTTSGDPKTDGTYRYEVTHLTCFVGGMFGLGGKIYERPEDVELAKKLTDGCVWAYETMPSGIMPEGAEMVPCESWESCPFNETLWWQHLDPQGPRRAKNIADWEERQELKKQQNVEAERKQQEEEQERLKAGAPVSPADVAGVDTAAEEQQPAKAMFSDDDPANQPPPQVQEAPEQPPPIRPDADFEAVPAALPESVQIAEPDANAGAESPEAPEGHIAKRAPPPTPPGHQSRRKTGADALKDSLDLNHNTNGAAVDGVDEGTPMEGGVVGQTPIDSAPEVKDPRPMTHEEYVKQKIQSNRLPEGFVSINHRHYILRPEAIESVWYMYRITGDPIWQEKGWRMFDAIVRATRTEVGNSAVEDILDEKPHQVDNMESFWLAETLKYFYLLFSEPDVLSLDEWVLNTEAHPFKRPT